MKSFIYRLTCDSCGKEIFGNRTVDLTQNEEEELIIDLDMMGRI